MYQRVLRKNKIVYNDAMNNGFYGEAELIVYAFLEDRLRAFLYYCDTINTKNSNNINEIAERMNIPRS